jgi:hypothetical protein
MARCPERCLVSSKRRTLQRGNQFACHESLFSVTYLCDTHQKMRPFQGFQELPPCALKRSSLWNVPPITLREHDLAYLTPPTSKYIKPVSSVLTLSSFSLQILRRFHSTKNMGFGKTCSVRPFHFFHFCQAELLELQLGLLTARYVYNDEDRFYLEKTWRTGPCRLEVPHETGRWTGI